MRKTKLKKLLPRTIIDFYKSGWTRMKLKYLIQVNQLYLLDIAEQEDQDTKQNSISISPIIKWKYSKNQQEDKILTLTFYKTGSGLIDKKLTELKSQIEALFKANCFSMTNRRDFIEYVLITQEGPNENYSIPESLKIEQDINVIDKNRIRLSKYHNWNFEKMPHCLISGNSGSGKSYQLYQIITEIKRIKGRVFVCDGKNDELTIYSKNLLKVDKIASNEADISTLIKAMENEMNNRFIKRQEANEKIYFQPLFLIIDEFAALKLTMEKKEYLSLEQSIKNMVLKARSANIHIIIALQRASAENMNLDIRDNCSLKIGLGNLSAENHKMIFNESVDKESLKHKEIGEGYIYLDGIIEDFKAFNIQLE